MLLYLVGLVTGILVLPLLALGPERVLPLLPDSWQLGAGTAFDTVYYPVLGLVLMLALTTLYRVALPLKPPWYRGLPGALLAALVFLAGSTGLRLYLDWLTGSGYTYGALAAPIAFLLATFFIALAIILGAQLNAAIQAQWPVPLRDRRGRLAKSGPGRRNCAGRCATTRKPRPRCSSNSPTRWNVPCRRRAGTERSVAPSGESRAGPRRPYWRLPGDPVQYGGSGCTPRTAMTPTATDPPRGAAGAVRRHGGPQEPAGRELRPGNVQLVTDVSTERGPPGGGETSGVLPSGPASPLGARPVAPRPGPRRAGVGTVRNFPAPPHRGSGCSPRRVTTRRAVRVPGSDRRTRSGLAAVP